MREELDDGDVQNHGKLSEIYSMLKTVMGKLDTLDDIKKRIVNVEQDVKELKSERPIKYFRDCLYRDMKVELAHIYCNSSINFASKLQYVLRNLKPCKLTPKLRTWKRNW